VTGDLARVVTAEDVRRSVDRARKSLADAALEVVWQIENEVWHVAGYDSWDAMREAEYGGAAVGSAPGRGDDPTGGGRHGRGH
jgi:hypothetical protein